MVRCALCLGLKKDKIMERMAKVAKRFPHFYFHRPPEQIFHPVPHSSVNRQFFLDCLSMFFSEKIQFVRKRRATNRGFF